MNDYAWLINKTNGILDRYDLNDIEDVKKLNDIVILGGISLELNPKGLKRITDAIVKHKLTEKIAIVNGVLREKELA